MKREAGKKNMPDERILTPEEERAALRLVLSLAVSLLLIVGGMLCTWHLGKGTARYAHLLGHEQDTVKDIQFQLDKRRAAR